LEDGRGRMLSQRPAEVRLPKRRRRHGGQRRSKAKRHRPKISESVTAPALPTPLPASAYVSPCSPRQKPGNRSGGTLRFASPPINVPTRSHRSIPRLSFGLPIGSTSSKGTSWVGFAIIKKWGGLGELLGKAAPRNTGWTSYIGLRKGACKHVLFWGYERNGKSIFKPHR
jgi:hypothetical protein